MRLICVSIVIVTTVLFLNTENASAQGSVPVGSVVAWSGPRNKIPTGWLECDGRELPRTGQYAGLFNAIGTTWGGTATDRFRIPDLRGMFLRGVSGTSGRDEDVAARTPAGNGPVNDAGSFQGDALRRHDHGVNDPGHRHTFGFFNEDGIGNPGGSFPRNDRTGTTNSATTGITVAPSGQAETRPENAYVYYIIRAR